jgi:dsDNA-specific endonuclease/ATPase MutS2
LKLLTLLPVFHLEKFMTSENYDAESPFPEPFEIEITDSIDLHAFAPRDIKTVVAAYLEEAYKKGFRLVRIIHGKGIGVQREAVRKILSETEFVKSFKNAPEFSSGSGATVVEFK